MRQGSFCRLTTAVVLVVVVGMTLAEKCRNIVQNRPFADLLLNSSKILHIALHCLRMQ